MRTTPSSLRKVGGSLYVARGPVEGRNLRNGSSAYTLLSRDHLLTQEGNNIREYTLGYTVDISGVYLTRCEEYEGCPGTSGEGACRSPPRAYALLDLHQRPPQSRGAPPKRGMGGSVNCNEIHDSYGPATTTHIIEKKDTMETGSDIVNLIRYGAAEGPRAEDGTKQTIAIAPSKILTSTINGRRGVMAPDRDMRHIHDRYMKRTRHKNTYTQN